MAFQDIKLVLSGNNNKPKRNRKLDRSRGLSWEDELTKYINDNEELSDAFNLGGSTTHIPDIVVFSNYIFNEDDERYSNNQVTLLTPLGSDSIYIDGHLKFFKTTPIIVIECKFTEKKILKVSKQDIDKGFEFVKRIAIREKFVVLAVKFKISKMKSKKYFLVMKYDYTFIRADYDYLLLDSITNYYGFFKSEGKGKQAKLEQNLNTEYFDRTNIKLVRDNFKIAEI